MKRSTDLERLEHARRLPDRWPGGVYLFGGERAVVRNGRRWRSGRPVLRIECALRSLDLVSTTICEMDETLSPLRLSLAVGDHRWIVAFDRGRARLRERELSESVEFRYRNPVMTLPSLACFATILPFEAGREYEFDLLQDVVEIKAGFRLRCVGRLGAAWRFDYDEGAFCVSEDRRLLGGRVMGDVDFSLEAQ
jgi:hypothetical protein